MSWDGTLSSGGTQKHGTAQHTSQGNPGTYVAPFGVTFDAAGAESRASQSWAADINYPANTWALGSDSRLYQAVISNIGNDPTTDNGTNWKARRIPLVGTANNQVPIWDNSAKEWIPGVVSGAGGGMPTGSNNQIAINDGVTPWIAVDMSGDATIVNTGAVTVVKSHGNVFPTPAAVKGDLWYASAASTLTALAGNTTTTKKFLTETGTGAAANAPAWSTIAQSDVFPASTDTQILVSNSGTYASVTASGDLTNTNAGVFTVVKSHGNAFPSPATVVGDVWYGSAANTLSALAPNTTATKKFFSMTGTGSAGQAPSWATIATGDLPNLAGDVTGAPGANTVVKINGGTVPSGAVLGNVLYGSAAAAYSLLAPNTTTTKKFLTMTGDGVNGAAPGWNTISQNDVLPSGTDTQTFYNNAGTWAATSFVQSDPSNSRLMVNRGASAAGSGVSLQVYGAGGDAGVSNPIIVANENTGSAKNATIRLQNLTNSSFMAMGLVGTANSYSNGSALGDSALISGQRIFIAPNSGACAVFDSTGVGIGTAGGEPVAKLDVLAGSGQPALNLTGVTGQSTALIAGASTSFTIDVTNTSANILRLTDTEAIGAGTGGVTALCSSSAASGSGSRYGSLQWGKNITGTFTALAAIGCFSEEDNTTNKGVLIRYSIGIKGSTTTPTRVEFRGNGDVCLQASGSESGTSTTKGFVYLGTVNGVPSGTPDNSYTGAVPVIYDRADNRLYAYNSGWQNLSPNAPAVVTAFTSGPQTITTAMANPCGFITVSGGITITCTLPTASSSSGLSFTFMTTASTGCTIAPNGTDKIQGANSNQSVTSNFHSKTVVSDGTQWWITASN